MAIKATIYGSNQDDFIFGSSHNETFADLEGNDFVFAGAGNDSIISQDGNDHLFGGKGNDVFDIYVTDDAHDRDIIINAGKGRDDVWIYQNSDLEVCSKGHNIIVLTEIDGDTRIVIRNAEHLFGIDF